MENKILLTESEAGDILRLPSRRVLKLARQGVIPHIDLPGDEIRFSRMTSKNGLQAGSKRRASKDYRPWRAAVRSGRWIMQNDTTSIVPELLTTAQAAGLCGVGERTFWRYYTTGAAPPRCGSAVQCQI